MCAQVREQASELEALQRAVRQGEERQRLLQRQYELLIESEHALRCVLSS